MPQKPHPLGTPLPLGAISQSNIYFQDLTSTCKPYKIWVVVVGGCLLFLIIIVHTICFQNEVFFLLE